MLFREYTVKCLLISIFYRLPRSTAGYQEQQAVGISTFNIFGHFKDLGYYMVPEEEMAALEKWW